MNSFFSPNCNLDESLETKTHRPDKSQSLMLLFLRRPSDAIVLLLRLFIQSYSILDFIWFLLLFFCCRDDYPNRKLTQQSAVLLAGRCMWVIWWQPYEWRAVRRPNQYINDRSMVYPDRCRCQLCSEFFFMVFLVRILFIFRLEISFCGGTKNLEENWIKFVVVERWWASWILKVNSGGITDLKTKIVCFDCVVWL